MRPRSRALRTLPGLVFAVSLGMTATAEPAFAAEGSSTPGATVTAVNPAAARAHGGLQIVLNAHSEKSTVENPSCRPQDATLDCWGSLVLRIPDAGGLSVSRFEVHRVAVGDIGCEHDDDGSCGGDHDDGHEVSPSASIGVEQPVQAVVNGVAVLRNPGTTGEPVGTAVQVQIVLTDNSDALHTDLVEVQVNKFVRGSAKPELYTSGPQSIQQVQIHLNQPS